MSDVEFSEEKATIASIGGVPEEKKRSVLIAIPIKLGLAKDETGSTIVLAAAGVVAIALAVIILFTAL